MKTNNEICIYYMLNAFSVKLLFYKLFFDAVFVKGKITNWAEEILKDLIWSHLSCQESRAAQRNNMTATNLKIKQIYSKSATIDY